MKIRRASPLFALGLLIALCAAGVLTGVSIAAYREREASALMARLGLEDVARRVDRTVRNRESVSRFRDDAALAKARALAEIVAGDPSVLAPTNRVRFDAYAGVLGVDEMHVSDEKGVLVRTHPAGYEGYDMAGAAQSAAFLPALTDTSFALVQQPQDKGCSTGDAARCLYAGVARRDRPGIIQIGLRADRIAKAEKLTDVDEIAASTRIGLSGRVRITKGDGREPSGESRLEILPTGERVRVYETDCEDYRIAVLMSEPHCWLSWGGTRDILFVLDFLLLLLVLCSLPAIRALFTRDLKSFREQFLVTAAGPVRLFRTLTSPLALAAFVFFAVVLALIAVVSVRSANQMSRDRLKAAAVDVVEDIDSCVDAQLEFIGQELCRKYGSPEAMRDLDMYELQKTYFVDEINVVDRNGLCLASSVPQICGQDQWSLANPALFCQALLKDGQSAFSQPFRQSATESDVYRKYLGVAFPLPAKGYLQIGFARYRLKDSIDYRLKDLAHNWHIGETGFFIVARAQTGHILSCQHEELEGETLAGVGFDTLLARVQRNEERRDPVTRDFRGFGEVRFFTTTIAGQECLCTSGVVNEFHRYVAAIPLSEVYGPVRRGLTVTGVLLFIVLIVVILSLSRLSDLVRRLQGYIASEKERQLKDLTLAKTIQTSALPFAFPNETDYRLTARMDTAREVGGDFYDFCNLASGKVLFLIADVSGKGVPAALFMMRAKSILRTAVHNPPADLATAVAAANDVLAEKNDAEMFVTAWIGVYDRVTHEVEFVNAGHNPPLVRHADGTVEWIRHRSGLVLAAVKGLSYRSSRLRLAPGEALLLYTDGVTEAMNAAGDQYGEERLARAVSASERDGLVAAVRADVTKFVAGAEPSDDLSILSLEVQTVSQVNLQKKGKK